MPIYRVILRAHLPLAPANSDFQPRGFYVTRIVVADSSNEAGGAAIRLIQGEQQFRQMATAYGMPELVVDEVEPAPDSDRDKVNRSGYIFWEDE